MNILLDTKQITQLAELVTSAKHDIKRLQRKDPLLSANKQLQDYLYELVMIEAVLKSQL